MKQFDVTVVPLSIKWGSEMLPDKGQDAVSKVLARYADGRVPDVVSPDVDEFSRVYRSLRDTCDGVISIHVSSKLFDTMTNAQIAREAFSPVGHGGPFPIAVVNSLSISMGLGWLVLAVARAAQGGLDLAKLVSFATRLRGQTHVAFITNTVDGLLKSGAAAHLKSQVSALATLKPLFHIDEGQVSIYERTRTRAKSRNSLYNFVEDFPKIGGDSCIPHRGTETSSTL